MTDTEDQTMDAEVVLVPDAVPGQGEVVIRQTNQQADPQMWEASPLALMDDSAFETRLELAKRERLRLAQVQRAVMVDGVDYGTIGGTQRPTLLKPGGEVLNKLAGLVATQDVTQNLGDGVTQPTIHYLVVCKLHKLNQSGQVVAEGHGSCNSWERKYRWRTGAVCPDCGETLLKSKHKPEWFCWQKKGGCGSSFPLNKFTDQKIENTDPFDLDNTILKMSCKRAMIDATLRAHAASGSSLRTSRISVGPRTPPPPIRQRRRRRRRLRDAQFSVRGLTGLSVRRP